MRIKYEKNVGKTVKKVLAAVREKGDRAILKYARKFEGVKPPGLLISEQQVEEAISSLGDPLKRAILQAKRNIETFHSSQREIENRIETMPGVTCWRRSVPMEKIGIYVPGGTAPLFSTVLMLGIPARLAGCSEIILCTPVAHPATLYAASLCGISNIYQVGGAQAIAAMAYGTASIPKVQKIFGPGNQFVTLAKQLVQLQGVAIDMPAGPSELLIIADDSANPRFVAADLLSQAEHGPDSELLLLTTSMDLANEVKTRLKEQLKELPRKQMAKQALRECKIRVVNNLDEAIALSNEFAPEHLSLQCREAENILEKIVNAGSVFIGNFSPVSAGDYASGTNHTLPTGGYAAMYSGVSIDSFVKKITCQHLSKQGLQNISSTVMTMAVAEGLEAHKRSIEVRL